MLARNLENAPAAEELPTVAKVLALDLLELKYNDPYRVACALTDLSRENPKWPSTPRIIMALMPKKEPAYFQEFPKLPPPTYTRSEATENMVAAFLQKHGKKKEIVQEEPYGDIH